jgi:hypothetical protein
MRSLAIRVPVLSAPWIALLLVATAGSVQWCQTPAIGGSQDHSGQSQSLQGECAEAARRAIGQGAAVLKCGFLNEPGVLEVVAGLKRQPQRATDKRILVSKLVLLRREPSRWRTALTASKQIQNEQGFIGIDFIDDSAPFWGYSVQFKNHRADDKAGFVLSLAYMATSKDDSEVPVDISWNLAVGRYQEFSMNYEPIGFKPELKNPPHRR